MLEYVAELIWDNQSGGEINIRNFPPIKLDTPVEFGGKGKYPCPDELFVSAMGGLSSYDPSFLSKKMGSSSKCYTNFS